MFAPQPVSESPEEPPRFDQENFQALFTTDELLDLPRIAQLAATLPGLSACVIELRSQYSSTAHRPPASMLSHCSLSHLTSRLLAHTCRSPELRT